MLVCICNVLWCITTVYYILSVYYIINYVLTFVVLNCLLVLFSVEFDWPKIKIKNHFMHLLWIIKFFCTVFVLNVWKSKSPADLMLNLLERKSPGDFGLNLNLIAIPSFCYSPCVWGVFVCVCVCVCVCVFPYNTLCKLFW